MSNLHEKSVESFYHLRGDFSLKNTACQGLACFVAKRSDPARWQQAIVEQRHVFCLGQCYQAPAIAGDNRPPHCENQAREAVLLGNVVSGGVTDIHLYEQGGGGRALQKVLAMGSGAVIAAITESGLRGRGGAGFHTGLKWQKIAQAQASRKFVVANADEGDPGTFGDRMLMERDPFRLIEAMVIAGFAVGAAKGYIYLRKEYETAARVLYAALAQAQTAGWLGENVFTTGRQFQIELVIGQGSYLCGEETAMLNSIEGRRPEARARPPQITEHGLFSMPTLVNNVETLCAIPWILAHGAQRYAAMGTVTSKGTKLLSLNSLFKRPGLYEVEFGISLREIIDVLGVGLKTGSLLGLMVGGPLAGLLPPSQLDTILDYETMQAAGGAVGHGGILAVSDDTSIPELIAEVFRFGALESCGKCTPCHLGSPELARLFSGVAAGQKIRRTHWHELINALAETSLCGHGRGLAEFARAIERHYPRELASCFN